MLRRRALGNDKKSESEVHSEAIGLSVGGSTAAGRKDGADEDRKCVANNVDSVSSSRGRGRPSNQTVGGRRDREGAQVDGWQGLRAGEEAAINGVRSRDK